MGFGWAWVVVVLSWFFFACFASLLAGFMAFLSAKAEEKKCQRSMEESEGKAGKARRQI
jgi:hypothetical protein